MAVYTRLGAEEMAGIIAAFDVGTLTSAKGIAEGVSNRTARMAKSGRAASS